MDDTLESANKRIAELEADLTRLYEEKEALIAKLESQRVRMERAKGHTYEEMRNGLSHELWLQGDVILCWVNEGDFWNNNITFYEDKVSRL